MDELGEQIQDPRVLPEGQFSQALAPFPGRSQGLCAAVTRQTREADAEERSCLE